jgi:hypothetical protein
VFQESSGAVIRLEQSLYLATENWIVSAGAVQKGGTLRGRELNRFREKFNVASSVHAAWFSTSFSSQARENVQ